MEFHEKLQELRKNRGLTQEELAEDLYVSRTAVSKWESGRGYPNIDSLKEISEYFSVTIDELLSVEKMLSIAEKESKKKIRNICELLFGIMDISVLILIVLPLYPNAVDGFIYAVNLFVYAKIEMLNCILYGSIYALLMIVGIVKLVFVKIGMEKYNQIITSVSIGLSILSVMLLTFAREIYAVIIIFLLLVIKGVLLFRYINS